MSTEHGIDRQPGPVLGVRPQMRVRVQRLGRCRMSAGEPPEPDTFPRQYVEELRAEAAESRVRAKRADDLAQRLHVALVAASGRLADPDDLPFSEAHLGDPDELAAAIDALIARKPHLADRRPRGDVGQGATADRGAGDLAGLLRARAG